MMRVAEKNAKSIEEAKEREETDKALALIRAKQLDLDRLKELCQPKRKVDNSPGPENKKRVLSDAQIQRQQESIARLNVQATHKKDTQKVLVTLKKKIDKDKKAKEEKERKRRMQLYNGNKPLAIKQSDEQDSVERKPRKTSKPHAKPPAPRALTNKPSFKRPEANVRQMIKKQNSFAGGTRDRSEKRLKDKLKL